MKDQEIIEKINSFPYWMYQFNLNGHLTPVPVQQAVYGTQQRKSYFFDPIVKYFGGSLKGKRVLDIGCNAGYWSLQAIEAGCDYLVGIDGRQTHLDQANFVFDVNNISKTRFEFVKGNIFELDLKNFGQFDIVICLGFFHHVNKHIQLLENISEVNNDMLILETRVSRLPGEFMQIFHEPVDHYANSIDYTLTMCPSKLAVYSMVQQFGYKSIILEPQSFHKKAMHNYRSNRRLAFINSKKSSLSDFPSEVKQITLLSQIYDLLSMIFSVTLNKIRI